MYLSLFKTEIDDNWMILLGTTFMSVIHVEIFGLVFFVAN